MLKSPRGRVDTRSMDAYWPPLLAAALVFTVFSLAAALWHRRRVAQLRRLLADAQHSRFEAEAETRDLKRRLHAAPPAVNDQTERRAALERALAPQDRPRSADAGWAETQPMSLTPDEHGFAPTRPMPEPPPR
ncbi:hypothetical protein G7087_06915 [Rubrivivax benzoatilyticus]|uniref:Uncharacterized protein n=1 Tax=Rubrivivax benzoatilyticus TaxID=316997 RepID=A0ABX0HWE0_9BURK|nr:hypothetical protein RBXJA2T_10946 [Rubrivivax benzoatilyticus JA2 = ATCC BAA-35]NHK98104.1 hypothetical protein [Rubrivivax benzoatilyticus]NHL23606.1 hypothetical protein [Rubrivivax benzoatilyticus]